jgi:vancomycin resistance protein YoaR
MVLGGASILSGSEPERTLAFYRTPLSGRLADQRHNAVLAARSLDGAVVGSGEELSFNRTVGSWSRDKGYRRAPVSFNGTLISAWGGGVCQTSTTLYNAALLAGFEIVERTPHRYAPNYVPPGRDAAVAFPNVDLRIRNPYPVPVRVAAGVSPAGLWVRLVGAAQPKEVAVGQRLLGSSRPAQIELGHGGGWRMRNPGKPGFVVETLRTVDGRQESLGVDAYPAMSRVVERSPVSQ